MPFSERQTLGHNIQFLHAEQLIGMVPLVSEGQPSQNELLEFDLKELSHRKCRELEQYVNKCLKQNQEQERREKQQKQQLISQQ